MDVAEKYTPSTVEELLLLFVHCIETYRWVHADQSGDDLTGIAAALKGSFGLLLRPEYKDLWEDLCRE